MTALTPDQMRALADDLSYVTFTSDDDAVSHAVTALRAVADQLETVPTRDQIAYEVKRVTHAWSGPSMDEFRNDPPTRKQYAIADAMLDLLNGAPDD